MERVLVTGGAGFIGSHIADAFLAAGYSVAVLDNLATGRRANVPAAARLYEVDVREAAAVADVLAREKPAIISHQAALADVRESMARPQEYAAVNILGTLNVLEAARANGARKVVMASTAAVYGNPAALPATETAEARPLNSYGVTKYSAELYLESFQRNYGLEYSALRYSNVYGPRQNTHGEAGVIAIFAGRMLAGEPCVIFGDGLQQRDFVYVGDVARANLLASRRGSGRYNIGSGTPTTIRSIFEMMSGLAHYDVGAVAGPARLGEVRANYLDASLAAAHLGWRPEVSLPDGLSRTLEWCKTQ
jgi:UDP-glucose 4-epimerase